MDRFIVTVWCVSRFKKSNLKSNMDRFIVADLHIVKYHQTHLKSNMDRFIVLLFVLLSVLLDLFKIQYG